VQYTPTIDSIAAVECGVGEQVKAITESAMRGDIDFDTSLKRRVALLKGADRSVFDKVRCQREWRSGLGGTRHESHVTRHVSRVTCHTSRVTRHASQVRARIKFTPGAADLCKMLKRMGMKVCVRVCVCVCLSVCL